jgi:polyhydroxyalkanoate synthase
LATKRADDRYLDPDHWYSRHEPQGGSWWPAWQAWLAERSDGQAAPPSMGSPDYVPIGNAPGTYVLMR